MDYWKRAEIKNMDNKLVRFIYGTRGTYMLIAIAGSMAIKFYSGATTTLMFFITGVALAIITQIFRIYAASYLWAGKLYPGPKRNLSQQLAPMPMSETQCTWVIF